MSLKSFSVCCTLLSVWGVIQLTIMGVLFRIETSLLVEAAVPDEEPNAAFNVEHFIQETRENYKAISINCFGAAGIYFITMIISYICWQKINRNMSKQAKIDENDDVACTPKEPKVKKVKEKKTRGHQL